ncbi:hypothetical protein K439DRAFT_254895 [Ramaria rubella]|nr:hypothetical protein K439DRAFT_254895 [Ramaria rubella]
MTLKATITAINTQKCSSRLRSCSGDGVPLLLISAPSHLPSPYHLPYPCLTNVMQPLYTVDHWYPAPHRHTGCLQNPFGATSQRRPRACNQRARDNLPVNRSSSIH